MSSPHPPEVPRDGEAPGMHLDLPLPPEGVTVELPDGGSVRVRPIRATDAPGLQAAFGRMSPESRYRRFFTAMPELPSGWAENLTDIDHEMHRAWVATDPGTPSDIGSAEGLGVGVARLITDKDDHAVAEAAIAVVDDYQGRGIGRLLFEMMISTAALNGIERIRTEILMENRGMIRLIRSLGAVKDIERSDRMVVCYDLPVPPAQEADITAGALYELLRYVAARSAVTDEESPH